MIVDQFMVAAKMKRLDTMYNKKKKGKKLPACRHAVLLGDNKKYRLLDWSLFI